MQPIAAGQGYVDLRAALMELNLQYGIRTVWVDSGGILNGVLMMAGLVDDVSVLVDSVLVGGTKPCSIFGAPDLLPGEKAISPPPMHKQCLKENVVWLR